jgi:hypothetical protein
MNLSAKGLVLDYFSFVIVLAVFTIARLLFEPRNFFDDFFFGKGVIEMKANNFLVGENFIAIGLLVAFSLQSENDEIL